MIDWLVIVPGLLGGLLIGVVFFGGLFWTIQRLPTAQNPALLFFVSFVVRTAIALGGFYVVAAGNWQRVLVAAVGFFVARVILVRALNPAQA